MFPWRICRGALGPRKVLGVVWGAGHGGYDPAKSDPLIVRCGPDDACDA